MRRLFALLLVITLFFGFAPNASADEVSGLVRCGDSPAFQERAKNFRDTRLPAEERAELYSQAYCGPEGLPHLVVDGRLDRAGDFLIPSILFLYIAGWIGWVGRAYLIEIKEDKNSEDKEIQIDVPLALSKMLGGFIWPLAAVKELLSGELTAKETEIPISPR